ncbi:hypothetical protein [Catenovulum agarivorans]|nr:hypothetical protein [Catenovulum agarivorans]
MLTVPSKLSAHEPCIQLRAGICPHKIIRSVTTKQPEFANKALCICISDFKELNDENLSEERRNELVQQVKDKYALDEQTLYNLLNGR